jgi:hypothetical protein
MIRDQFPGQASVDHARGFSGARTRIQWSTHQASVEAAWVWGCGWGWCARALGLVRHSRKILGKSWEIHEPVAKSGEWVHQSRPEKRRYLCHVTQPRARVNVSCNRTDQKGQRNRRGPRNDGPREAGGGGRRRAKAGCRTKGSAGKRAANASEGQRMRHCGHSRI